jgi:hypothetical protein
LTANSARRTIAFEFSAPRDAAHLGALADNLTRRSSTMVDANDRPPTADEVVGELHSAEQRLTKLLELLVTMPRTFAELVDQGGLIAHCAEARRDIRTALARLTDDELSM